MAPMKRHSAVLDDHGAGQEVIFTEGASSTLRQSQSKRQRLADLHDSHEDRDSSPLSDADDLDLQQASQYAEQQRMAGDMDNMEADNGIIESITCQNFMCHVHLDIRLGPLINFVVGRNGSGKSAILTALAICLGGKASSTNRGQSLKSFIMTGQDTAILSVKIKNTGGSGHKRELYGDHIIVERQFSRSGSSGFKLKSSTGRIISTRKADLDAICDDFALQIDNPMNVLTQDMARQFLNNSNPYDKYKFFMKGTQLEMLDADYLQIEQSVDVIEMGSEIRERDLKDLEDKYRKAERLLQLSQEQDSLRAKIAKLSRQMAWAQVEEQERALAALETRVRKSADDIREVEREVHKVGERYEKAHQLHDLALSGVHELEEDLNPLLREEEEKATIYDQKKAEAMDIHSQQRQIQSKIKEARQSKRKTEELIQEENRRLESLNGGSHTRRLEEIEEKRQEALEARTMLQQHESQLRGLEQAKRLAEDAFQQSGNPIEAKDREIQQCEQELQNLMRDQGQGQRAYHQNLPRLLGAIQQDGGFKSKPVGPMGHHVRLMKPRWSSILEKTLGSVLDGFVVTSKADQSRLSALARRVSCPCQIFIGQVNAISKLNEPDPKFDTMLRVLEIDSELVRNQLVIGQSIEQTILIEDLVQAQKLMDKERLVNVKQCLSIHKTNKGAGARTAYGYQGLLTETYIPPWQGLPRMKTDYEFQTSHKRDLLKDLKTERNYLEEQKRGKQIALKQANEAIVRYRRRLQQLTLASQRAQETVEGLEDALEQDAVEEGRLDELKRLLNEAVEEAGFYEKQYGDSVIDLDKAKLDMEAANQEMQEVKARVEEARGKITAAEGDARKLESQTNEAAAAKNKAIEAVGRLERRKREAEDVRDDKAKVVEEFIGEASKISEREPVPAGETGDSLDKKLSKLTGEVARAERHIGGSGVQIAEAAQRATIAFKHAEEQFKELKELTQLLKYSLMTRRERWRMFQKFITARAKTQFTYLVSERGYKGRLISNHKERKLDIQVDPKGDANKPKNGNKGGGSGVPTTQGLSGGEKSFTTICLLLSLWEAMGAPIRCLDEFDVFMDSVNRTVSVEMMIKAARRNVGKQFIFITPGSMDAVPQDKDVKVTKMRDPERGLQPIRFPAQPQNGAVEVM